MTKFFKVKIDLFYKHSQLGKINLTSIELIHVLELKSSPYSEPFAVERSNIGRIKVKFFTKFWMNVKRTFWTFKLKKGEYQKGLYFGKVTY